MNFEGLPAPGQGVLGGDKEEPLTLRVHLDQAKTADDIFFYQFNAQDACVHRYTHHIHIHTEKRVGGQDPVSIFFNFLKAEHRLSQESVNSRHRQAASV